MIRQPINRSNYILLSMFSVVLVLIGYTWLSYHMHYGPNGNPLDRTLPTWSQLADGVQKSMIHPDPKSHNRRWIVMDLTASMKRLATGVLLGILLGVLIGLHMGCFESVEAFFRWPTAGFAAIPATAALTVFLALAGTGETFYIAFIVFGMVPPLATAVWYAAKKDVPPELLHKAYTLGASDFEAVWNVTFPQILPKIMEAVSIQTTLAIIYLMAAEYFLADVGMGFRTRLEGKKLDMAIVFPYLVVLALVAVCITFVLREIKRELSPWYEGPSFTRTLIRRFSSWIRSLSAHSEVVTGTDAGGPDGSR